jgi:Nucleotidyltransferase domain
MALHRLQVLELIGEVVGGVWSEAEVQAYGSVYTGLELPSSDVDVVVCGVGGKLYAYGEDVSALTSSWCISICIGVTQLFVVWMLPVLSGERTLCVSFHDMQKLP